MTKFALTARSFLPRSPGDTPEIMEAGEVVDMGDAAPGKQMRPLSVLDHDEDGKPGGSKPKRKPAPEEPKPDPAPVSPAYKED